MATNSTLLSTVDRSNHSTTMKPISEHHIEPLNCSLNDSNASPITSSNEDESGLLDRDDQEKFIFHWKYSSSFCTKITWSSRSSSLPHGVTDQINWNFLFLRQHAEPSRIGNLFFVQLLIIFVELGSLFVSFCASNSNSKLSKVNEGKEQ